jgi:hypothetical protein
MSLPVFDSARLVVAETRSNPHDAYWWQKRPGHGACRCRVAQALGERDQGPEAGS